MKNKITSTVRISCLAGLALAVIVGFCGHVKAQASTISYTFSSVGTGSLGASSFNGTSFTITSTADTSQITNVGSGTFHVPDLTATVFVSGIGSGTFNISTINVDNQPLSRVGLSDPNHHLAMLFVGNGALATYDLSTSIGPLSGPASFNSGAQFGTTAGNFSLTSVSNVTFQATIVPEPQLTIIPAGANVILTWPTNYAGFDYSRFALQSTTNLGSAAVWSTNLPAPVVVNVQNVVTNPITGRQQFFRLRLRVFFLGAVVRLERLYGLLVLPARLEQEAGSDQFGIGPAARQRHLLVASSGDSN